MKYLITLLLWLGLSITFDFLQAQNQACYVDVRTITTDWRRTAETTNDWDWTARTNPFNLSHTDNLLDYQFTTGTGPLIFTAPFYPFEIEYNTSTGSYNLPAYYQGSNGVSVGNVDHFRQSFWFQEDPSDDFFKSIDYRPEDGWELIARNFNINTGPDNVAGYAYFILYNRYAGIVRPFFFIKNYTGNEANKLAVRMAFNKDMEKTALMALASPVSPSVQSFIPKQNHVLVTNSIMNANQGLNSQSLN